MGKGKRIVLGTVMTLLAAAVVVLGATVFRLLSYLEETQQTFLQIEQEVVQEQQEETIDVETFKQYAQEYNVNISFLQRFFDDVIVYKSGGEIIYQPIDETLEKNTINWDHLLRAGGKIEYWENGVQAAHQVIDVSSYQGQIDWQRVKADGIDEAYIRLGYRGWGTGEILLDEQFKNNIENAKAAGVRVGVYFFSQAISVEEAEEEAEFVLQNLEGYELDLPVAFDTEQITEGAGRANLLTPQERTDVTIAFCEKIKGAGYQPMVYANVEQFFSHLEFPRIAQYEVWFAQYFTRPFFPYSLHVWQYSASGTVDGIEGPVDLNLCFSDCAPEDLS